MDLGGRSSVGLGGQDDIWCQCCNPPQAGVKGQALVPSPPPPPSPAGMGPVTGGGSPVLVTAAPGATARLQLGMSPRCRALSQLRVPRRAGGHPWVRSSSRAERGLPWAGQERWAHPSCPAQTWVRWAGQSQCQALLCVPARLGISSGTCSHRPRLRQGAQHGQATQHTPLPPPHPPL